MQAERRSLNDIDEDERGNDADSDLQQPIEGHDDAACDFQVLREQRGQRGRLDRHEGEDHRRIGKDERDRQGDQQPSDPIRRVEPAEDVPIEREPNEDRGGDCQGGGNKMIARHARQDHGRIGGRPVESAMGQVHEAQGTRHEREAGGEEDEHDAEVQAVERPQGEIR